MKQKRIFFCAIILLLLLTTACSKDDSEASKKAAEKETPANQQEKEQEDAEKENTIQLPDAPLYKGDEKEAVKALQLSLKELDYPIETSGVFDDLTTWAITDIQLQHESIYATGLYENDTKDFLQELLDGEKNIVPGKALSKPEQPDSFPDLVENPYDILAIANKGHSLPEDYVPNDLVVPDVRFPFEEDDPKKQMRAIAADAIEELFAAGDEAGVTLFAQSGYRSYDRQVAIFASNMEIHGEEHANTYSAKAGESEHQTGLVMDVTSQDVGFDLIIEFGETEEGKWLKDHAHEYGFIIRYPEDKVDITKYQYEPWHIRYVGKKAAAEIYENQSTLEEYFGLQ